MDDNKRIIRNSIITPDGTVLISKHRHDYVTHIDKNGLEYMVDGGNDYLRRNIYIDHPHIENSLYSDAPFEEIRQAFLRGGRGKDGKQPLTWVALKDMSDEWLEAALQYNLERGMGLSFANMMYVAEQDYRKVNNIYIAE
jgi:hypothetical protein